MAKTTIKKKPAKTKSKSQSFSNLDFTPGFWEMHWREALIIPILAFALYWMCLPYGYVLDDQIVITGNDYTKKGVSGIWEILSTESFSGYFHGQQDLVAGARYRPLSIISFAVEQSLFGDNRIERHFINILLYGLIGLLIFRVLSILFPKKEAKNWLISIPFIAVILYILHPVHSEVVANIKGRDEIMTAIGAMGALYCVLRYLSSGKMNWLIFSGVAMFLGLMAKENAVTFLAVIPLTMYFFTNAKMKDYVAALIPSFIAFIIYMIIRTNVIGYVFDSGKKITDLMNDPFIGMNTGERYATILYTLGQYVRLLVYPHPLTHDYYPYHIPIMNFGKPGTLISLAIYLGLALLFFKLWKRKSIYAWAIGFFVATVSIVSNLFFPVGTFMNERFIFIPSIAFSVVCAWVFIQYGWNSEKKGVRFASIAILVFIMGAYIFKTYVRVPAWKDSLSLNGQAAMVSVNSARNNCFMGTALFEEARDMKENDPAKKLELLQEADYYVDKSLAMYPTYSSANQIKSGLVAERYLRDGDLQRLLDDFTTILNAAPHTEYVPQFLDYLNGRAPKESMIDFYYKTGYELLTKTKREYPTAVNILKLGEKIAPDDPRILFGLGKAFYGGGDQVQGTKYLERAYQINPGLRDMK
ncbi:MAG: glycosyltransferase family 39 protein [Saprospiraceae bacterium]